MEPGSETDITVVVVSIAIIPAVFIIILLCIKIRVSRSNTDIYGVEGTVTRKCEEQLNISNGSSKLLSPPTDDNCNRTPSYDRKLPELPEDVYRNGSTKDDNTSELYATVDDNIARTLRPEGATALPNVDQNHHSYARVKKQGKQEHPYAKVRDGQNGKQELEDDDDDTEYETTEKLAAASKPSTSSIPTLDPPQGGPSGSGNASGGGFPLTTTSFPPGPGIGFPPSGSFAPWVPPPARNTSRQSTPLPPEPNNNQGAQQHFSGDSQESTYSTKGYTSISVREPLENLRPQVLHPQQQPIQEGNYVTLSETSDEMYAAIEDTVYMDPMGSAHAANRQQQRRVEDDPNIMYSKIDKSKKRSERPTASYDNGYATVNKIKPRAGKKEKLDPGYETVPYNNRSQLSDPSTSSSSQGIGMQGPSGSIPVPGARSSSQDCTDGAGASSYKDPEYEVLPGERKDGKLLDGRDPDYETVPSGSQSREPGYETLPSRFRADSFDPGYETLSSRRRAGPDSRQFREYREPGYETVSDLRRGSGLTSLDPDYESVANNNNGAGNTSSRTTQDSRSGGDGQDPGYEGVGSGSEPGYETLPDNKIRSLHINPSESQGGSSRSPGSVAASRPRAAPAMQPPSSPPRGAKQTRRIMGGVSEPELHTNVDTNIEYKSINNYPPTHKLSMDSEEGYETIPDISKSAHHNYASVNTNQHRIRPPITINQSPSPDPDVRPGSSRSADHPASIGSRAVFPLPIGASRAAPPIPEPYNEPLTPRSGFDNDEITYIDEESSSAPVTPGSPTGSSDGQLPVTTHAPTHPSLNSTRLAHGTDTHPPLSAVRTSSYTTHTSLNSTHTSSSTTHTSLCSTTLASLGPSSVGSSVVASTSLEAYSSSNAPTSLGCLSANSGGALTSIGSLASPETPGSPTIHMSVVNTGQGVRRASVVMIERVDEEKETLTSFDNHVYV